MKENNAKMEAISRMIMILHVKAIISFEKSPKSTNQLKNGAFWVSSWRVFLLYSNCFFNRRRKKSFTIVG